MGLQHIDTSQDKAQVYENTFGHLAPVKNTTYKGYISIAKGYFCSGSVNILDFEFNGLESSPWLFSFLQDEFFKLDDQLKEGFAYKYKATFRNYRLWLTEVEEVDLTCNL